MIRIAIHSVPRSGSSWLGQMFNSSQDVCFRFQPLFSYAFKDYLNKNSSSEEILNFFKDISESNDEFLLQVNRIKTGEYPLFEKKSNFSHIVYKEVRYHNILENLLKNDNDLKVIGLVRSPFAVINSFLQSPKEFRKDLGWIEKNEWRHSMKKNLNKEEEFFGYEKWKEVYFLFQRLEKEYEERFCLVYYDDLILNTVREIERIFNFSSLSLDLQTIRFIEGSTSLMNNSVYSVFRKKINDFDWKSTLPYSIYEEIQEDLVKNKINRFIDVK